MGTRKLLLIAILVIAVVGVGAIIWGVFFTGAEQVNLNEGQKNILVLAVDESEPRPGLGAVDMAFVVRLENGTVKRSIPVYPSGIKHPTVDEPAGAGVGGKMLLHDSLWYEDNQQGMQYAKEIVEHDTNHTMDAVVAVNTEAIDYVINSSGGLNVNGTPINIRAIDLVREEQDVGGMSRGEAVLTLTRAAAQAAKDPVKKAAMVKAAYDQLSKGNILSEPQSAFESLATAKGLDAVMGK